MDRVIGARAVGILIRIFCGIVGGYGVTAIAAAALASLLPVPRNQAVLAGQMASFAIYAAIVLWTFAVRTAARALVGALLLASIAGALILPAWLGGAV